MLTLRNASDAGNLVFYYFCPILKRMQIRITVESMRSASVRPQKL